jgi:hypothetical protein
MRDLIPIGEVLNEIMTTVFQVSKTISYQTYSKSVYSNDNNVEKYNIPQSTVFEDNNACLQFARFPKLTPQTKHIGIPYNWFRSYVESYQITLVRVDTTNQLADQFTKGLPTPAFCMARKNVTHTFKGRVELAVEVSLMKCYKGEVSYWSE